jgi:hypothetical protein
MLLISSVWFIIWRRSRTIWYEIIFCLRSYNFRNVLNYSYRTYANCNLYTHKYTLMRVFLFYFLVCNTLIYIRLVTLTSVWCVVPNLNDDSLSFITDTPACAGVFRTITILSTVGFSNGPHANGCHSTERQLELGVRMRRFLGAISAWYRAISCATDKWGACCCDAAVWLIYVYVAFGLRCY